MFANIEVIRQIASLISDDKWKNKLRKVPKIFQTAITFIPHAHDSKLSTRSCGREKSNKWLSYERATCFIF